METLEEYKKFIEDKFNELSNEANIVEENFNRYFMFDLIFSSDSSGKTRLNRQEFNENNERIETSVKVLDNSIDEILDELRETVKTVLSKYNDFNKVDLVNLVFDDKNFFELLQMDLNNQVISKGTRKKLLNELDEFMSLKNKFFNLKYLVSMFNTENINKYLNRLGIEDLINSKVMFEIINIYGLKLSELNNFKEELKSLSTKTENVKDFKFLEDILVHHTTRASMYSYAGVGYKIFIEYDNDLLLNKEISVNRVYLENIISNLIEQSCMDVVKKELKKGKIQKVIDIEIKKKRDKISVEIKNNGYEVSNIHTLYLSDQDNKFIIEAKNLATEIDGELKIESIPNEGMTYILEFKAEKAK